MNRTEAMLGYLPIYLRDSQPLTGIVEAEAREFDRIIGHIAGILAQFSIQTATWGLDAWEEECGLPVNPELPYADRRVRIMAAQRGSEICTLNTVREVIKAFTGLAASCFETDSFRAGISAVGEPVFFLNYPFTIRRKFVFAAGFSTAGEEIWDASYAATLMLNLTQLFRAGMSAAGDQVFMLNPDYIYLEGGSLLKKSSIRSALEKILPARMQLIIN